jgi:hypothetical protein
MMGRHRWHPVRIQGQTAHECRDCGERDFNRPNRGPDLDDVNKRGGNLGAGGSLSG